MRWVERIFIAFFFFGAGFIVGWHPTFESVRNFVINGLSFGVVIGVGGFLAKLYKDRRETKRLNDNVLSEIELNQNILKPLSDLVVKALESNDELSEDEMFPSMLNFENRSFETFLGHINTSEHDGTKLQQYYNEINYIEKEYDNLKKRDGEKFSFLISDELSEIRKNDYFWHELNILLRKIKDIYDLGEELKISLIK